MDSVPSPDEKQTISDDVRELQKLGYAQPARKS